MQNNSINRRYVGRTETAAYIAQDFADSVEEQNASTEVNT